MIDCIRRIERIRTVVVDDEALARSSLTVLLRRDQEIEIIGTCSSGTEAIETIRALRPHLVFLDVQMPECNGFEVLEQLGGAAPSALIFVTAYDEYALGAFDAGALDYLVKPFDDARFERALVRAKRSLTARCVSPYPERLVVRNEGQVIFVKPTDIDWIEAADYYACVHVGRKVHLLRRSLTDLEQQLDPAQFCRIHRTSIVNVTRIRRLERSANAEPQVVLECGKALAVSRRFRRQLQMRLGLRAE